MERILRVMSVYKDKKNNTWYVSKRYQDWKGENKCLFKRNFKTKKEAQSYENEFLMKKSKNINMKFDEFIDLYYEDRKRNMKLNAFITKQNIIEHSIRPYFKNKKMCDITPTDVMNWHNEILKFTSKTGRPYSASTLKTIHAQLSAIFNHAVRFYKLERNPANLVGTFHVQEIEETKIWTVEQYRKFSDAIADKTISYIAFEILFWCGLRVGELLALTKEDIIGNKIRINKNLQVIKGEIIISTPKTKRANRYVDMPDFLVEEITIYLEQLYRVEDNERIFPITKSYLHHEMDRGSKLANVPRIRIHDLRHSHISMLLACGFSAVDVASRVGHESIRITYKNYAHVYDFRGRDMANMLDTINKGD